GLRRGIDEVVESLGQELRSTKVHLWIKPAVLRPRVEVSPCDANVQVREPGRVLQHRIVEAVSERDLAELGKAAILHELRAHCTEPTTAGAEPVLTLLRRR